MNNIKKTGLGMLVATLAFGFSAFTTVKRGTIVTYYKVNTAYSSTSPYGYAYYSEDRCMPSGNVCTAKWDIGTNPTPSADGTTLPTSGVTFQTNSIMTGHFE